MPPMAGPITRLTWIWADVERDGPRQVLLAHERRQLAIHAGSFSALPMPTTSTASTMSALRRVVAAPP